MKPLHVPCGKCPSCQENYKKDLLIRAVCEYEYCDKAMFITLTVDEEHMEEVFPERSLRHEPFQRFIKRFRKLISPHKIRYLMCGEYGELGNRPHYHCIIFDFSFDDMYLFKTGKNPLFRSPTLEGLWTYGFSSIGNFSGAGAAYLAKYVVKSRLESDIERITANGILLKKPYIQYPRSKKFGGLGYRYFLEHKKEMFELGYCLLQNGTKVAIPRYFKKKLRESEDVEDKKLYDYYLKNVIKMNEMDDWRRDEAIEENILQKNAFYSVFGLKQSRVKRSDVYEVLNEI